jgi:hypothetical protein
MHAPAAVEVVAIELRVAAVAGQQHQPLDALTPGPREEVVALPNWRVVGRLPIVYNLQIPRQPDSRP